MLNRITIFALAGVALGGAALPQAAMAADYYDGGADGGGRPYAFHSRDDVEIDGDRARFAHRQAFRPASRGYDAPDRASPGPVVFDERETYPHRRQPADDWRPIAARPAYGDDEARYVPFSHPYPPAYGGPAYGGPAYGAPPPYRPAVGYREVSAPLSPDDGGGTDVGCTIEQARSITPAGWRKTVTHKTCYRR